MTTVTLIYMTPSLEGHEGVDPANEFESLEDLISRAGFDDLEPMLNKAVCQYLYLLEARETDRTFLARAYGSNRGIILDDEETDDYHQADIKVLDMEVGTLEDIRARAGLESVDELLRRSLILFEKIVVAREYGLDICLFDDADGAAEWIVDPPQNNTGSTTTGKFKGPTLQ